MNFVNHTVSHPAVPPPWWQLPPGFVPAEPFHPQLKVIPEGRILERVLRKLGRGDKEGASELLYQMARALHAPNPVDRDSIFFQFIPGSNQPPTVERRGMRERRGREQS